MRRKRLVRLLRKLRVMRKSLPKRDPLLLRIGAARKEAGRAFGFVKIQIPKADEAVTRKTFSFQVDKAKLKAAQQRDGHYLLRSNLTAEDPAVLWTAGRSAVGARDDVKGHRRLLQANRCELSSSSIQHRFAYGLDEVGTD